MKKLSFICFPLTVLCLSLQGSVTFAGFSSLGLPDPIELGSTGVMIADVSSSGFGDFTGYVQAGWTLLPDPASGDTVNPVNFGSNYRLFANNVSQNVGGNNWLSGGAIFNLVNSVSTSNPFAILVFDTSSSTTVAGDTFWVFTDPSWVIPSDGSNLDFPGDLAQIPGSATLVSYTVVPEPAHFAFIFSALVLFGVALRRRFPS